jgi:3-oxoacyl-[acyl-carrier protein] reductase
VASSLRGKVAVVTGSSRGIGRAIAERLAQDGATVVVNHAHSAGAARKVVSGIEARGGQAMVVQADMSRVIDIRNLFREVIDGFGRLDILVNNAGIGVSKPLIDATEADFDKTFALNARGAFFGMQEAARRMADGGRIVSISSVATVLGSPNTSYYAGSKAAVEQFTKVLAKEIGGRGITVNAVSPGFTDTATLASLPQFKEIGAQLSPLGRLGQPRDIADVVAFLVSEQARWITGQNIEVGGGVA